jgi:hypothetical protein
VLSTTSFTYDAFGNLHAKGGINGTYECDAADEPPVSTPGPHGIESNLLEVGETRRRAS